MAVKLSAKQAAIEIGTDARTLRKFIRDSNEFEPVGQGNRYQFTKQEVSRLKKAFLTWSNGTRQKVEELISADDMDHSQDDDPDADVSEDEIVFLEADEEIEVEDIG